MRPLFARAAAVIVPVQRVSGTRLKISDLQAHFNTLSLQVSGHVADVFARPRLDIDLKAQGALADLERARYIDGVLTQNVDGLHQAAGSTDVVELHGNILRTMAKGERLTGTSVVLVVSLVLSNLIT